MQKPLLSLATTLLLSANLSAQSLYERLELMQIEMNQMQKELQELKKEKASNKEDMALNKKTLQKVQNSNSESIEDQLEEIQENLSDLNKATNGNHLKFGVDYRFSLDYMHYKMLNGKVYDNNALLSNRFWLNMSWAPTKSLSFRAQLAYNKAYGERIDNDAQENYETFDWTVNETPSDGNLRLRYAYFLYQNSTFLGANIPWTFSIGRRPSTNGHLINLRDDDSPASPMGHTINVEFDGLSSKFDLAHLTGVSGMYIKLCAGRGLSVADEKYSNTPFSDDNYENQSIDLGGLIFSPWSNGQYAINTQYYYANNLIDVKDPTNASLGFETVGGMHSFTANFIANGIGDGLSDFLDDTTFFVSWAVSITNPKDDKRMLYSQYSSSNPQLQTETGESKKGYSTWVGIQIPSLISEDGRWGFEYNHGTKYWRSITYAEDTLIGSKMATRGDAYEAYFTEYLIEEILSLEIRYTYIDYAYTGSQGFFGSTTGASYNLDDIAKDSQQAAYTLDTAQDIRFYLRYKY